MAGKMHKKVNKRLITGLALLLVFALYGIAASSEAENEALNPGITILNPHSHPKLGGNWTVYFNATGSGTLEINDHSFPEEVGFIGIYRKGETSWESIPVNIEGDIISAKLALSGRKSGFQGENPG